MEPVIHKRYADLEPDEVDEINLSDICTVSRVSGLEKFVSLRSLLLNSIGLETLDGFPELPLLEQLELNDNHLSGGLDNLVKLKELTVLRLSGNRIDSVQELRPLRHLKKLQSLDLSRNLISSDYRSFVFDLLPSLKWLDELDRDGHREYEGEEESTDVVEDEDDASDDDDEAVEVVEEEDESDEEDGLGTAFLAKDPREFQEGDEDDQEFEPEPDHPPSDSEGSSDEFHDNNSDEDEDAGKK
eukprot:CAMPEP_0196661606 /NCGR_PEP_ID=MMETSP1086-20130531/45139_1 /TAXON_ID=77921 /ORGANISM="Cyanoptyche  gloeocystis , Strain SAG4.97" /LENGTH=242 /DNA_ID=CAMNT_0041996591 /DNA_START=73 /DNA_END=801 /DNA_ORIENTATION=+